MDHVPFGDTPLTRCEYYRLVCGLPAYIDQPALGWIAFNAGRTGALTMPTPLAVQVRERMQRRGGAVGPTIVHLRSNRWTFLIRPDVPSPTYRSREIRRWIEIPHSTFRPSGMAVVEAIRTCTGIDRDSRSMAVHRG